MLTELPGAGFWAACVLVLDGVAVRVPDEEVKDNEDLHSHHGRGRHG